MNYTTLRKDLKQFQSVSGLSHLDFLALHKEFALVWQQQMQHWTADGKPRLRSYSVRSDSVLKTTEDMLLFVLSYLKNNPTQEYHSSQWGMTQSQAHPWLQRCQAILRMTLQRCDMTPARTNLELLERLDAQDDVARHRLDGTERPIERPHDDRKQKKQYSGKKKAYHKELGHQ